MTGDERRENIKSLLTSSDKPVSGSALSKSFGVSRQVIVQDIALLRKEGYDIASTNLGYVVQKTPGVSRVFKTKHSDEDAAAELYAIVDSGGVCKDVFVYHKVYGVVRAGINIRSRDDADRYLQEINSGKSFLLKNITSDYHYHTVSAESTEILDKIQQKLQKLGFLARLQDYEPVDFWN
ncbi:MAG: transcription repressor NadR [Lachnospiraceae bacterium]|nr:transcription repressor NadR [Lachnospiraceae bacterium]